LENDANDMRAVTLANWAYAVTAIEEDARGGRTAVVRHLPVSGLRIRIRTSEDTKEVVSCMLEKSLKFTESGESIVVELPRLDEGDVLLLKSSTHSR
jgi:hypothetical protein